MKAKDKGFGNKELSVEYGKCSTYFDSMRNQSNKKYLYICKQTSSRSPLLGARSLEAKLTKLSSKILDLIYILDEESIPLSKMLKYALGKENYSERIRVRVKNFSYTFSYSHYMHKEDIEMFEKIIEKGKVFLNEY